MSLIKKIDVEDHFAARRAMRLGRTGPLSQASVRMRPVAAAKTTPSSLMDGVNGHPSPSASLTSTPIAAGSDGTHASTLPRNRRA